MESLLSSRLDISKARHIIEAKDQLNSKEIWKENKQSSKKRLVSKSKSMKLKRKKSNKIKSKMKKSSSKT